MARIKTISSNLNALLDTIAYAEGTSIHALTKDDGYDVIVSGIDGAEVMTSYIDHPFANGRKSKVINRNGLMSNAAGRYQQMLRDWPHYKKLLNLFDFGPISQDKLAIRHIQESSALLFIEQGKFNECIERIANIWASLPGAGYGQFEHKLDTLRHVYLLKGGKFWDSKQLQSESLPRLSEFSQLSLPEKLKESPKPTPITPLPNPESMQTGLWTLIKKLLTRK